MKYCLLLLVLLAGLAACGNPVSPALKWIGTPEEDNLGFSEIYFTIKDPELVSPSNYNRDSSTDVVTITINLDPLPPVSGTGAPYTDPEWFLYTGVGHKVSCIPVSASFSGSFKGELYWLSNDSLTIKIDTKSLPLSSLQVLVEVTGSDGRSYENDWVIYK
jgi:hypothetical protein